jgi:hypothetical protein
MNSADHDGEMPLDEQPLPEFLHSVQRVREERDLDGSKRPEDILEEDLRFIVDKTRSKKSQERADMTTTADPYAPAKHRQPSRFLPNPETEEAANRVAEQAKTIVTQTSSVVRRAIAELQRELKELDDILIAHEKQSHAMIDDHLKVSTECASAVIGIRQNFEGWKNKVKEIR